jgi:hypothetical protein
LEQAYDKIEEALRTDSKGQKTITDGFIKSGIKILKPPDWLVLKDDEIFVDAYGLIYANYGYEEIDSQKSDVGVDNIQKEEIILSDSPSCVDDLHKFETEVKFGRMPNDYDAIHEKMPKSGSDNNNDKPHKNLKDELIVGESNLNIKELDSYADNLKANIGVATPEDSQGCTETKDKHSGTSSNQNAGNSADDSQKSSIKIDDVTNPKDVPSVEYNPNFSDKDSQSVKKTQKYTEPQLTQEELEVLEARRLQHEKSSVENLKNVLKDLDFYSDNADDMFSNVKDILQNLRDLEESNLEQFENLDNNDGLKTASMEDDLRTDRQANIDEVQSDDSL